MTNNWLDPYFFNIFFFKIKLQQQQRVVLVSLGNIYLFVLCF